MTIEIPTVPTSVPFAKVQELVRAFGFETKDLVGFSVDFHAVTATVHAHRPDGKKFLVGRGRDAHAATHQVVIPVDRTPATDPPL